MKYLKFVISPTTRALHPIDETIEYHPEVTHEALLHVDSLPDGAGVLLYRLRGDPGALGRSLTAHPDVRAYELVDMDDDAFHIYIQVDADEVGGELISLVHENALIIDTPLEYTDDGLRVTLVGTHDRLREALCSIPDELHISVEQAGEYTPGRGELLSPLTERQLEVFKTAVQRGYYEVPRRTTHKDLAKNLDCAPSTVDEHLRKAESHVVSGLLG
ncbi:helix-turn-helix domain-containing protein [Haladaptatus sp. YSMS36]|uniref:helix-turn-helix domain-containing protein n=1 Tax=Haladaptatus sp. YSMS36 TaxID=3033384 RepID=UPI0023E86560|nr:helix-turn-helix domain-containing protein [Haladaptatus sp. YSMS36]